AAAGLRDETVECAKERLAGFKRHKSIDFTAELPRDPNGKLYKRRLRDPYWAAHDRAIGEVCALRIGVPGERHSQLSSAELRRALLGERARPLLGVLAGENPHPDLR